MTMRFSLLKTHWNADDAYAIIAFLDELRDALWETYETDIIEDQIKNHERSVDPDRRQIDGLEEDGCIDF
jgi:hypothetical protein